MSLPRLLVYLKVICESQIVKGLGHVGGVLARAHVGVGHPVMLMRDWRGPQRGQERSVQAPVHGDISRYNLLDGFGPDIEFRETRQDSARHAVRLEKVNLAGGERRAW